MGNCQTNVQETFIEEYSQSITTAGVIIGILVIMYVYKKYNEKYVKRQIVRTVNV